MDAARGLAFGIVIGLAVVWILAGRGAVQLPGQVELRREVQRSAVVKEFGEAGSASRRAERVGARGSVAIDHRAAAGGRPRPSRQIGHDAQVRTALSSVVRIPAAAWPACGLRDLRVHRWVAGPNLVVTNAHVVAGQTDTTAGGRTAIAVAFDPRNDVAVLRVDGLSHQPLAQSRHRKGHRSRSPAIRRTAR